MAQLVQNLFDPRVHRLQLRSRLSQAVSHHRLVHKCLSKGLPLETVLEGGGQRHASLSGHAHGDGQPLVVKVGHDDPHAVAFASDQITHGNGHIIQLDISRSTRLLASHVQSPHRHTGVALERDHQDRESVSSGATRADGHGGVVGPDSVGDPARSASPMARHDDATYHFFVPLTM